MSMSDQMILRGRVGTGLPLRRPEDGGRSFVRFRMVVPRSRRKDNGEWEDGEPQWHTVRAWGSLAENLAVSLHKGQPIVVIGRPAVQAWISREGELKSELAINAITVGHDLGLGVSLFSRITAMKGAVEPVEEPTAVSQSTARESHEEEAASGREETALRHGDSADVSDRQEGGLGDGEVLGEISRAANQDLAPEEGADEASQLVAA